LPPVQRWTGFFKFNYTRHERSEEIEFTAKGMSGLSTTVQLAQEMENELDHGEVLQQAVQPRAPTDQLTIYSPN
jgi:hypothetical protein